MNNKVSEELNVKREEIKTIKGLIQSANEAKIKLEQELRKND
jgi:hypothetical protein